MLILILELRKTRLIPAMKRHVPSYANYLLLRGYHATGIYGTFLRVYIPYTDSNCSS